MYVHCQQFAQPPWIKPCLTTSHILQCRVAIASRRARRRSGNGWFKLANNATTGQYRRLTGVLRMAGHSPMLETGDDRILRLVTSEDLMRFDGLSVVVEGSLTGLDRLHVEWIGRPVS